MRGAGNHGEEIPYRSLHLRSSLATSSRLRLLNSLLIALNRAQKEKKEKPVEEADSVDDL